MFPNIKERVLQLTHSDVDNVSQNEYSGNTKAMKEKKHVREKQPIFTMAG